jgi:lysyl-tRNA synthetase class 2
LKEVVAAAAQDPALQDVRSHPRIACWRKAYQDLGTNPNKYNCSIESLARRARKGDQLAYINTLVALFNYFSIKHVVTSGGDDLGRVDGDLHLIIAKGNEPFTPFNDPDVLEHPDPGEVIYMDNSRVMCRRWNWRQGDQTKLFPTTKNVAINVDCLPPVTSEEARRITAELADLVKEFCGGDVKHYFLSAENNEAEI